MRRALLLLIVCSATYFALESRAAACGGCVAPPNTFTAVDSHRMVIKLGIDETILWDQFIYSGAPEEFAWLLPVPTSDVVVEIAGPEFVQRIDEGTAPIVAPASPSPCGAAGAEAGGCGCGELDGVGGFGPGPVDGVDVYDRQVVGPYETVTLGSEDPNALFAWLAGNGYAYPATAIPTLDHYIERGSAFVVLRLRPGADVSAMQPVRVRFRGFMGSFPLEMVTVGAGGVVDLSLWVIAEQRYQAANYPTVTVDEMDLVWDWQAGSSNYDDVFDDTIARAGGRAWVTEYAGVLDDSELAQLLSESALEDYVVATEQIHYPYLTRLRTSMLVDHIDQDLQLAPSEDATDVARELVAMRDANYECAGAAAEAAGTAAPSRSRGWQTLALVLAAALFATRRRRPRTAQVAADGDARDPAASQVGPVAHLRRGPPFRASAGRSTSARTP